MSKTFILRAHLIYTNMLVPLEVCVNQVQLHCTLVLHCTMYM